MGWVGMCGKERPSAAFFEAVANQQKERERGRGLHFFSTVVSRRIGLGLRSCFRNAVNSRNKP